MPGQSKRLSPNVRTEWLSIDDVAESLGCSKRTVLRWAASRELPSLAIGQVVRISEDSLDEFLLNHWRHI